MLKAVIIKGSHRKALAVCLRVLGLHRCFQEDATEPVETSRLEWVETPVS